MKLIRGQKRTFELGKLLVRRAKAGVTVLVLHFSEQTRLLDIKAHNQGDADGEEQGNPVKDYFKGVRSRNQ